ncbi:MAG TPA: gamma-glutamyl-gamma-aminobutyrate hydrolase family protein [Kouleothrix sp.]|nr:gamma-glutamyl-gamma-aminobutyrate hydrolase family protein [Kouleothrix sp.]
MKPTIGISCGAFRDRDWCPPANFLRKNYTDAIVTAGGLPLIIPMIDDIEVLRALYDRMDGIVISGGGDIDPRFYRERPLAGLGPTDPARDEIELPLARWAVEESKPLLGICRGAQVINVALGGTLYQDIPSQIHTQLVHDSSFTRQDWTYMAHELQLEPDSKLAHLFGTNCIMTNSLHHQSLKDIAPGLRPVGWAPDGVVEAIEGEGESFLVGVQCHPEALQGAADVRWQALFRDFVASCAVGVPAL